MTQRKMWGLASDLSFILCSVDCYEEEEEEVEVEVFTGLCPCSKRTLVETALKNSEVFHWVRTLDDRPEDLSLIPETHTVNGANKLFPETPQDLHMRVTMYTYTYSHACICVCHISMYKYV